MAEDHLKELKAAHGISHVVDRRITRTYSTSLNSIETKGEVASRKTVLRPQLVRSILMTTFLMVNNKLRRAKEEAFR